jgi:hypothetical protein
MQTSSGPIPIRISKTGEIIDRAVTVRKSRTENVEWIAQDGAGPWTITFDKTSTAKGKYKVAKGSPFKEDSYEVPRGRSVTTTGGPVRGNPENTYRYQVKNTTTGEVTDDPDVDVES